MKEVTAIIDFFMNEDNMQYLLKGNEINNLNEVHHNIFTNIENYNVTWVCILFKQI